MNDTREDNRIHIGCSSVGIFFEPTKYTESVADCKYQCFE